MRTLLLLSLIATTISCSEKGSYTSMADKNNEIVKQYYEHFNNHDWQKMADMYVENAEFKDPTLGEGIVIMTRAETVAKYSALNEVFPDLRDSIVQTYPSGDKHIIVEFVSTGTSINNQTFELPICTIFTIENGKITQDFTYFDNF